MSLTAGEVETTLRARDEMSPVFQKASQEAKSFGAEVMSALKRVESSSYETTKAANELHRALLEAFENPLASLKNYARSLESDLIGSFGTASIAAAAFVGIVGGSALAIFELAEHAATAGSELKDMAVKANVSVETMGALKYVAGALGGSVDGLANSMFIMGKNIESGSAQAQKGIQSLGLSWQEFSAMSPDQQLLAMSDAMRALPPEVNKSAIAFEIFGRQGREMLPKLLEPMRELYAQGKLNNKWTEEAVEKSKQFEVALNTLKMQVSNIATAIGRELIEQVLRWIEVAQKSKFVTETLPAIGRLVAEGFQLILAAAEKLVAIGNYLIDKWNNLPPVLKNVAETAALTAAGLWALNAASNAVTGSGIVDTIGSVLQTTANLSQTFGTSLPAAITSAVASLQILKLILIEDGIAAAGLAVIGAVFTSTAALVGALGVAAVGAAVGLQQFVASAVTGEGGLKGLQDAITNTLDPMKKLGEAARNTSKDIQLTEEGLSSYTRAVKSGTLDIYAQALANNLAADAQKRLADDIGRFSNETLVQQMQNLTKNKAVFDAWAKEVHLSAEAIEFLTKATAGSNDTLAKLGAMHDTVQKAMVESTKRGVEQRIALAEIEGAAALRVLKEQHEAGKLLDADYAKQRAAQEAVNAENIKKILLDAERTVADEVAKLRQENLVTVLKANKDEMAVIQETADFEIAQKAKEFGSVKNFEELKTAILANAVAKRIELYRKEYDTAIAGIKEVAAANAATSKQHFDDTLALQREHENNVTLVMEGSFELQRKQVQQFVDDWKRKLAEQGGDTTQLWDLVQKVAEDRLNNIEAAAQEVDRKIVTDAKALLPKGFSDAFATIASSIPNFIQSAFTGGGGISGALQGLGSKAGESLFGSMFGNIEHVVGANVVGGKGIAGWLQNILPDAVGKAIPFIGPAIGALMGPLLSKIMSIGGPSQRELEGRDIEGKFEQQMGGWQGIQKALLMTGMSAEEANAKIQALWTSEKQGGDAVKASIDSINKALKDTSPEALTGRMHAAFSMIESKQLTVAEGTKIIDDNWKAFVDSATDGDGRVSASLKEIIALNEKAGTQSKEIAQWQKQQAAASIEGANAIFGGMLDPEGNLKAWDELAQKIKDQRDGLEDLAKRAAETSSTITKGTEANVADQQHLKNMFDIAVGAIDNAQASYDRLAKTGKATDAQLVAAQAKVSEAQIKAEEAHKKLLGDVTSAQDAYTKSLKETADAQANLDDLLKQQQDAAEAAQQDLSDLGVEAVAAFAAAVAAGESEAQALKDLHPSLSSLSKAYKDLGLDVKDVGLKTLLLRDQIMSATPALLGAVGGLAKEMIALDNLGLLNVATFGSMERTGMSLYTRLQGEVHNLGGTTVDALGPMQDYLHAAFDQAKLLGEPLDANTQMLIDQSKELGIWKDKGKSATDIMIGSMQTLVDKVQDLIDTLNHVPPKIHTEVVVDQTNNTTTPGLGFQTPEHPEPMALGGSGRTTGPTWFYSAGNEDFWFGGEGHARRDDQVAAPTIKIEASFNLQAIDRRDVAAFIETQAMPHIVELLEDQVRDYVPRINRALGTT